MTRAVRVVGGQGGSQYPLRIINFVVNVLLPMHNTAYPEEKCEEKQTNFSKRSKYAGVVKLANTTDLKSVGRNTLRVRFPSPASY